MIHEDICPTTAETEQLELRARQMETEPASQQLGHQESSHSSVGQRQDLQVPRSNSPVTVSDSQQAPHSDTQGATSLQEASDDTNVAEEMEMRGLHPLSSSDDDDLLYSRSSMVASPHSTGTAGDEELEVEMHDLDSERVHKPLPAIIMITQCKL